MSDYLADFEKGDDTSSLLRLLNRTGARSVLALAEIGRPVHFRQANHLGTVAGGGPDLFGGPLRVFIRVRRHGHLDQADREGSGLLTRRGGFHADLLADGRAIRNHGSPNPRFVASWWRLVRGLWPKFLLQ